MARVQVFFLAHLLLNPSSGQISSKDWFLLKSASPSYALHNFAYVVKFKIQQVYSWLNPNVNVPNYKAQNCQ